MNRQNNLKAENPAKEALIVYICSVLNRAGNLRDKPFTNYIGKLTRQVFGARVASVESETVGSIQRENDQSKHEVCCKPPSQRFGLGVSPFHVYVPPCVCVYCFAHDGWNVTSYPACSVPQTSLSCGPLRGSVQLVEAGGRKVFMVKIRSY